MCRQPAAAPSVDGGRSPYPFCSDRCRLADLNRWLEGEYQIPTDDDDLDEATPDFDVPSR
ncbi:MAG: DNA gyrase inhibitor YacG [Planctomycetota bacterium]